MSQINLQSIPSDIDSASKIKPNQIQPFNKTEEHQQPLGQIEEEEKQIKRPLIKSVTISTSDNQSSLELNGTASDSQEAKRIIQKSGDSAGRKRNSVQPPQLQLSSFSTVKTRQRNSILKNSAFNNTLQTLTERRSPLKSSNKIRPDVTNNTINTNNIPKLKHPKKPKVQFHEKMELVYYVESHKKYNNPEYTPNSCTCLIQ